MVEVILLVLMGVFNVATLVLVFVSFNRTKELTQSLGVDLKTLESSNSQIAALQASFKSVLEEMISRDRQIIENTTNSIIKYYQDTLQSITQNYNLNVSKLSSVLNEDLTSKLDSLGREIESQGKDLGEVFAVELQKNLKETDKRLGEYYNKRVKDIEAQIYQLVDESAKNIVARSLNTAEHQELVFSALEEARKDKFFS